MVRLQHAQSEGYITAARADKDVRAQEAPLTSVLENVVGSHVFLETMPSPSCRSLLLIEMQSARVGAPLKENEMCRLKSEADGKYLHVGPDGMRLTMVEKPDATADLSTWHEHTLFSFVQVRREGVTWRS